MPHINTSIKINYAHFTLTNTVAIIIVGSTRMINTAWTPVRWADDPIMLISILEWNQRRVSSGHKHKSILFRSCAGYPFILFLLVSSDECLNNIIIQTNGSLYLLHAEPCMSSLTIDMWRFCWVKFVPGKYNMCPAFLHIFQYRRVG
jgi:hypothetical protein